MDQKGDSPKEAETTNFKTEVTLAKTRDAVPWTKMKIVTLINYRVVKIKMGTRLFLDKQKLVENPFNMYLDIIIKDKVAWDVFWKKLKRIVICKIFELKKENEI